MPGVLQPIWILRRQFPRVSHENQHSGLVFGGEPGDDGTDRGGLGLVPLEHRDLRRVPIRGDEQPDGDLGVDPPFLRHSDPPEAVFVLGFEVQRGQIVKHQPHRPAPVCVGPARRRDPVAVLPLADSSEAVVQGFLVRGGDTDLAEHPDGIEFAGRLDDPGQHELGEHLIVQLPNPTCRWAASSVSHNTWLADCSTAALGGAGPVVNSSSWVL
ncbi:MAG: hypothetical protein ABF648_11465 [Propionibacterium sp.]